MTRLLTLKQSVSTLEDLGFTLSDSEPDFDEDDDYESLDLDDESPDMQQLWLLEHRKGLEPGELSDLLEDARRPVTPSQPGTKPLAVQSLENAPPKKKRRLSETSKANTVGSVFDLEEPEYTQPFKGVAHSQHNTDLDDGYGEASHLQIVDAADKSARKKSLRFHTAKIEHTSARRQGARNQAMGGDDDIPYQARQKDKEARLREAINKRQNQGGEDIIGLDQPGNPSAKRKRGGDYSSEEDSEALEGYYGRVSQNVKEKKERKKADYEAGRVSARVSEEKGVDGPRSLTRAILINKGLTPRRPKAVRNPRVKKRQKYEKAKKKLASQKSIYKGGLIQSGGHYEGEKSGISKVIKSVRLG